MPNNQQTTEISNTDCDETLFFAGVYWVVTRNAVAVIEDGCSLVKGYAVLHDIDDRFFGIPIVFHSANSSLGSTGLLPAADYVAAYGFMLTYDGTSDVMHHGIFNCFPRRTQ